MVPPLCDLHNYNHHKMKTVGTEHGNPVGVQGKQTSHHLESTRGNKPGFNVSTG